MTRLHILLLLMVPMSMLAQQANWEASLLIGGTAYQGDLTSKWYPSLSETEAIYGLMLKRNISSTLGLRFTGAYATYKGDDPYKHRGYTFHARAAQLDMTVEWEPLGKRRYPGSYQFYRQISPYIFAGIGTIYYEATPVFPITDDEALLTRIEKDQSFKFPSIMPVLPIGVGVKMDINRRWAFLVEAGTQTAFSDDLDGISNAANPSANDWLAFGRAGFVIRFLPKDSDRDGLADIDDACPKVKGNWSAQGCPDRDEDGVEDLEDLCPDSYGVAALNGCPDRDGDGVADILDRCPYEAGPKAAAGCPDWDKDGLSDVDDSCPKLPGSNALNGCPVLDVDADGSILDENNYCIPAMQKTHQAFETSVESIDAILRSLPFFYFIIDINCQNDTFDF